MGDHGAHGVVGIKMGSTNKGVTDPARQRQWQVFGNQLISHYQLAVMNYTTAEQSMMTMEWNGSIARLAGVLRSNFGGGGAGLSSIQSWGVSGAGE